MVAHTFDVCQRVATHLQARFPEKFRELVDSLDFARDLPLIGEMARGSTCPARMAPPALSTV